MPKRKWNKLHHDRTIAKEKEHRSKMAKERKENKCIMDKNQISGGVYYDTPTMGQVYCYGGGPGYYMIHTNEEYTSTLKYEESVSDWTRSEVQDWKGTKNPRIPYSFDLHYDIKRVDELKQLLKRSPNDDFLRDLMRSHDITIGDEPKPSRKSIKERLIESLDILNEEGVEVSEIVDIVNELQD